jgi:phosphoribosyl-AMP cyclohydrolase / phosphoribosyl-ATP pyrophosphohydrolase
MPASLPLTFDASGLLPVIVQDHLTGELRMFAFATQEAILKTIETGRATFWSRSRGELWEKGRTSANPIRVHRVLVDCDADSIVYSGEPEGPSCHTGAISCFFQILQDGKVTLSTAQPQTVLAALESVLEARKKSTSDASYTKSLYDAGPAAIGAKIREEAGELAQAVEKESDDRVISEAADTVYHVLVGLQSRGIAFRRVLAELYRRMGTGGHEEKAHRKA